MGKTKKQRESEYKKIQDELKLFAGQSGGWIKIDKKLKNLAKAPQKITPNDLKSLNQWIAKEKETRIESLKTELGHLNDFFMQYKEHPKSLRQVGLFKKGLSQSAPMYDTLIELNEMEIKEINLMLDDFFIANPMFAYQTNPEWLKIRKDTTIRKKEALENQLKDIKKNLAEVEEEIETQKGEKDKRIAQIKEELKELGEKFPKDELSYIG